MITIFLTYNKYVVINIKTLGVASQFSQSPVSFFNKSKRLTKGVIRFATKKQEKGHNMKKCRKTIIQT